MDRISPLREKVPFSGEFRILCVFADKAAVFPEDVVGSAAVFPCSVDVAFALFFAAPAGGEQGSCQRSRAVTSESILFMCNSFFDSAMSIGLYLR